MTTSRHVEIAIIGAGVAGVATAYYLCTKYDVSSLLLIDSRQPMSFTSAQSGDNYRNWWPHPVMVNFTNDSIDLMERMALESSNLLNITRRGYAIATRRVDIGDLIADLYAGYGDTDHGLIRVHSGPSPKSYQPPVSPDWKEAPDGVDVLSNQALIQRTFPSFSDEIANVVHIRRAGDINGHLMAQHMLDRIRKAGGKRLTARVTSISDDDPFVLGTEGPSGRCLINADVIVNATGPFAREVARMIDVDVPIDNVFQQKIAFEDHSGAVPRQQPFSIDLDDQELDWSVEERDLLAGDPDLAWLIKPIPGGVHCRPEGGERGTQIKLGWAYNRKVSEPQQELANDPHFDAQFPEIVMRGAAALNPSLRPYTESFPSRWSHYGGYYPMTPENWPLIGPLGADGAFVVGALSGFGSMSACAAGALCAAWIADGNLPDYARQLSLARYDDQELLAEIRTATNKGIL